MYPDGNQSFSARRRAALMRMRLKIDIEGAFAGFVTGLLEGENFSVLQTIVRVNAGACDVSMRIDDNRTDIRIG
jgi:hypothetical protein